MTDPRELQRLRGLLLDEMEEVRHLADESGQVLASLKPDGPDLVQTRALALILHDFYTGVERMVSRTAREIEGALPTGPAWHRDLLTSMAIPLPEVRPAMLSRSIAEELEAYLSMRHRIRNVYGRHLDWRPLAELADALPDLVERLGRDVDAFADWLQQTAREARE